MRRHSPLNELEQLTVDRMRERFPSNWKGILRRIWEGELPLGTRGLFDHDQLAVVRLMRNNRGLIWLGNYRP